MVQSSADTVVAAIENNRFVPYDSILEHMFEKDRRGLAVLHAAILADKPEYLPHFSERHIYLCGIVPEQLKIGDINARFITSQSTQTCSTIHLLAFKGYLDRIGRGNLAGKTLQHPDSSGRNVFHYAAIGGHLDQLPPQTLNARNLNSKGAHIFTPLVYAAACRHLDQVPTQVLKEALSKSDFSQNFLSFAATNGNLDQVPDELLLSPNGLLRLGIRDGYRESLSPLETALESNSLCTLPPALINSKIFGAVNFQGNNLVNSAAQAGVKLPELDLELYAVPDVKGQTALHHLIAQERVDCLMHRKWPGTFEPIVGAELWNANCTIHNKTEEVNQTFEMDMF